MEAVIFKLRSLNTDVNFCLTYCVDSIPTLPRTAAKAVYYAENIS